MSGAGRPRLSVIAAVARNGVIGREGGMPWRLPTDLKRFRAMTMGKPVVMGRRTFEGLGRPLDGRVNVVVSRDPAFAPNGALVARDLDGALALAAEAARAAGAEEVMVIGGGTVYAGTIGRADRLYLTEVDAAPEGDTLFPAVDPSVWAVESAEDLPRGERDSAGMRLVTYVRRGVRAPSGGDRETGR